MLSRRVQFLVMSMAQEVVIDVRNKFNLKKTVVHVTPHYNIPNHDTDIP